MLDIECPVSSSQTTSKSAGPNSPAWGLARRTSHVCQGQRARERPPVQRRLPGSRRRRGSGVRFARSSPLPNPPLAPTPSTTQSRVLPPFQLQQKAAAKMLAARVQTGAVATKAVRAVAPRVTRGEREGGRRSLAIRAALVGGGGLMGGESVFQPARASPGLGAGSTPRPIASPRQPAPRPRRRGSRPCCLWLGGERGREAPAAGGSR